jgi:hypothetical protein
VLAVVLAIASGDGENLRVEVQPCKPIFSTGSPPCVRVTVINPPGGQRTWYVQRKFWTVPYSTPMYGDLALSLQVTAPSGEALPPTQIRLMLVRMKTHPSTFVPRATGTSSGCVTDTNPTRRVSARSSSLSDQLCPSLLEW